MQRPPLRLDFSDFWPGFDKADNWLTHTLEHRFDVELCDDPDVVVFSCYGSDFRKYDCTRVLLSWENRGWGFSQCDWAFTSDRLTHPRHLRVPLWVSWLDQPFVQPTLDASATLAAKEGFAALVVSNGGTVTRNRIHDLLETYRPVASGGRFRNNVGGPVDDKDAFIRRYKFSLAVENSSFPGYVTEKLLHALQADTVPIYWGDPHVGTDFNTRRFVNVHDFATDTALLARIIEIDRDDDLFCSMLNEPWFPNGRVTQWADLDRFLDRFEEIRRWEGVPVARRRGPQVHARAVLDRWSARQRYRRREG